MHTSTPIPNPRPPHPKAQRIVPGQSLNTPWKEFYLSMLGSAQAKYNPCDDTDLTVQRPKKRSLIVL